MKSIERYFENLTTVKSIHIILIMGVVVFAKSMANQFAWDDIDYILDNPTTRTINIINFFTENIFNGEGQYRPLTVAYFAILHTLFGSMSFFYHITQLILHIINTCFLYILGFVA